MSDLVRDAPLTDDVDDGDDGDDAAGPVLELRGVHAAYGRIEVLHGVDLAVPRASVVALLGPNGAGKTTTLGVASGQIRPTAGELFVGGRRVTGASPAPIWIHSCGFSPCRTNTRYETKSVPAAVPSVPTGSTTCRPRGSRPGATVG